MRDPAETHSLSPVPLIPQVEQLLGQMTLAEKAGQMSQYPARRVDPGQIAEEIRQGRVGSILNAGTLERRNELQRIAVDESRLGIPLIFGRDVIHGYRTVFPIPLGQAASFNPTLVEEAAAAAAREAAEAGIDWTFAPMVDISRDPRWGRVAESCGEDPFLASELGAAMVRGFQGRNLRDRSHIAACAKHYAGYGAAEGGKDYNSTHIPEQLLREVYLAPFRACVEAGVLTLMSAFNDLNGVPASGNELTLRRILKGEWGFGGFVVSDWASMREMIQHGTCTDEREVAIQALRAGVDLEMASRCYQQHLPELVETGIVPLELVDDAVRRLLNVKHQLGLFDKPYAEPPRTSVAVCAEHRALARQAARESAVLLKNDAGVLPLGKSLRRLAVVGPLARDPQEQIGCWAFDARAEDSVTLLDALQDRLGARTTIEFAPGVPDCRSSDRSGFSEAVAAARRAEVALVCLGEIANMSGEARCRAFLDLPGAQSELLRELSGTGTPIVLVLMAGRPLVIGAECDLASAVLSAWHGGTMAGPGLADVLLGETAPSGKLPVTFPRTVGQIPIYYAHKNTGRPPRDEGKRIPTGTPLDPRGMNSSYLDVEVSPEFPFGFGLSYTTFDYADLTVSPPCSPVGGSITVTARVTNTGKLAGDEVVQLYVRDLVGSVTRPVRELKGFSRVHLEPGESKRVEFVVTSQMLAFPGRDMSSTTESGKFQVFVGGDSRATLTTEFELE